MEGRAPEISVIIPVYKVEKYLRQCVDSVLTQTFQDFEIVLVDDESPDGCPQMCDDYAGSDSRIKVVHKKNGGLGFARNSGLDAASGKYVCFLDSDDYLDALTLEFCHELAEKEGADQVRFLYRRFKSGSTPPRVDISKAKIIVSEDDSRVEPVFDIIAPILQPRKLFFPSTASSCTAIYRREIIEENKLRFPSERELISEDYVFTVRMAFACRKIVYTDLPFYNYRINPQSLTTDPRADRVEKCTYFSRHLASLMREYGYPDAEIYAMGYTIGEMRAQNRLVFLSKIPHSEKRKIFNEVTTLPYVTEIMTRYPVDRLSLMQRIAFRLHLKKCYWLSYLITMLRETWK